jgi:hypothetical protein
MAKFTSGDFLRGAEQALAQQNFPAVYKNAHAALALGAPQAAFFLCVSYHHQIVEGVKRDAQGVPQAIAQFGIMYKVSEHYQLRGYTNFTPFYQDFFGVGNNKMPIGIQKGVKIMSAEYIQYLQAAPGLYPVGVIDIIQAEGAASAMEQVISERTTQKQRAEQAMEMSAPPPPAAHDYHPQHPNPEKVPLIGHKHSSNSECCCGIS